jgi:glycosyltransferase involved in cell wall biosynthesis
MVKRVIIAVSNDLATDQRVQRVARSLTGQGYIVLLTARVLPGNQPVNLPFDVHWFHLWFNKGPLFYAGLNIRLFCFLLLNGFDVVLSNDLDTLPACRLASIFKHKKIIYDSHEYFTEVPELVSRKWQKACWTKIEKIFLPGVNHAYTVCQSLANIYMNKYNVHFQVIRNVPHRIPKPITEVETKSNIIIYQGALNLGRGIELMIKTMCLLPEYKLWIAGTGDIEEELKELSRTSLVLERVLFLGRLTPGELNKITEQACLGLSIEEDLGLNYHYALPNKLFDYIQSQIPVIVSDLPEMRAIVEQYGAGEWLTNRSPENLATLIRNMSGDPVRMHRYHQNLAIAAQELCWENEEQKLIAIFKQVL